MGEIVKGHFGTILMENRERRGLKQGQVARMLGVSQSHVSACERGAMPRRIDSLVDYASAVGADQFAVLSAAARHIEMELPALIASLRPATKLLLELEVATRDTEELRRALAAAEALDERETQQKPHDQAANTDRKAS